MRCICDVFCTHFSVCYIDVKIPCLEVRVPVDRNLMLRIQVPRL